MPQVLGASVATHSTDLTPSIDFASEYLFGDTFFYLFIGLIFALLVRVCRCKDGSECHCSTAKKPSRPKSKDHGSLPPISPTSAATAPVPVSLHALRPVLPRPLPQLSSNEHVASHPHPHNHRFSHGSAFFSPYGRAWEEHHYSSEEGHADSLSENGLVAHRTLDLVAWSSDSSGHSLSQKTFPPSSFSDLQDELDSPEFPAGIRGFCTCGETCTCLSCLQHRGPIAWSSREACSNPGSCDGCIGPSEVAPPHPAPTPPTTPQDGRIAQQFEPLEEWIKNIPMIPPSFDDGSKQEMADPSIFDLPRIVEPMPITLDSLPDVFHEPTSQCICASDQRMCVGDYCVRCQRRCDDHELGADLLANSFSADRTQRCNIPFDVPMLSVPPPRSRASSTSSIASDLSSHYPASIDDPSGVSAGSLIPPSLSRVRRFASDITSSMVTDGPVPPYSLSYHSSAPDLALTSSDSYDTSYPGSISMLF